MKKQSLIFSLSLLALWGQSLMGQTREALPKLVVGITIDQLCTNYVEDFSPVMGENGFKRLWREGLVYTQGSYDFDNLDGASAVAAVYTGTSPYVNGIIGERWMDRKSLRVVSSVDDKSCKGWFTNDGSSAAKLRVTTLTDELKVATGGKGLVCSIAPDREAAVMAAGHAADIALWKNDLTGIWCGSEYYGTCPVWVTAFNRIQQSTPQPSLKSWEPLYTTDKYVPMGYNSAFVPFNYSFEGQNGYRTYKTTACMNDEMQLVAQNALTNLPLGDDDTPDFLALTYYAGNYKHQSAAEAPLELQDIYVRLDRNIAALLAQIDKKVGLANVLIFVTSTGYVDAGKNSDNKFRLPVGELSMERVTALLNVYLGALYGKGDYVETSYGTEIYLNRKLAEQKQIDFSAMLGRAADFLIQMTGIQDVFSANELNSVFTREAQRVRNGFNYTCSGDLSVQLLPGWRMADGNDGYETCSRNTSVRFPIIYFGKGITAGVKNDALPVSNISFSVARMLRIACPNGNKTR